MSVLKTIVKHSMIVILVWIILVSISIPLLLRLDEVTEYRAERLLPNGTETMRAYDLLAEIMGSHGAIESSLAFDVVVVEGVNASDKQLLEWDNMVEEKIKDRVTEYNSPYKIVRDTFDEIKPTLLENSKEMFDMLNMTYYMLLILKDNRDILVDQLNYTATYLHFMKEYYDNIYENESFRELVDQIYENLSSMLDMYENISGSYNETVDQIRGLKGFMKLVYMMLFIGDNYYSATLDNLSSIYYNMTMLKQFLIILNSMYYELSLNYTLTVYDITRIHYYLLYNTTAYIDGLNQTIIEQVIRYTNSSGRSVSGELINTTYHYVVDVYGLSNTNISTLYMIASNILEEEIRYQPIMYQQLYTTFLAIYNNTLYNTSLTILTIQNITDYINILFKDPITGQYELYQHLLYARNQSLPVAVELFARELTPMFIGIMGLPEEASPVIETILFNAYSYGYPLNSTLLEDLVVYSMYNLTTVFTNNTLYNTTITLYRGIYECGPDPSVVRDSLRIFLIEAFPMAQSSLSDMVYQVIISIDPNGDYVFVSNENLILNYTVSIIHNITFMDEDLLYNLYTGLIDEYEASHILMKEMIVNYTGRPEMELVVDIVYRFNGSVTYNGFRELFRVMFLQYPELFIGSMPSIEFSVGETNFTETLALLADHLAYKLWFNELTRDYVFRFMVGAPLVFMTIMFTNSTDLIDQLLYELPVINSIVNNTYDPSNPEQLFDSLETVFNYTNMSLTPSMALPANFTMDLTRLFRELYSLPENISSEDLLETFIDTIVSTEILLMTNITGAEGIPTFSIEDLKNVLYDVLVRGVDPLNALINMSNSYMTGYSSSFNEYLRESLITGNYTVLYIGLCNEVLDQIFDEITANVRGQMISPNNNAFLIMFKPNGESTEDKYDNAWFVRDIVESSLKEQGFNPVYVGVTGDDVLSAEAREANSRDIENVQRISMIAPIIIAIILIGGLLVAGLPFLGIAASVAVSSAIVYILGYLGIIDVTSWSRMLLITTSFGLGMDYSTYIILRFKEQLPKIKDPIKTAYESVKYALPAISAAASTDIIGFAVMVLAWDFPLIASIGETVPIAIACVLAASLTLTPALLAKLGDKKWFWWPHRLKTGRHGWRGYSLTRRRAYSLLVISLVILGIGVYGLSTFRGSHDYTVFMPENTPGYRAYMKIQELFPVGQLIPIYVVGKLKSGYSLNDSVIVDDIKELIKEISGVEGVISVYSFLSPGNKPSELYVSNDNRSFYLEVIIKPSPMSREGVDLTKKIRDIVRGHDKKYYKELLVGGLSASSVEIEELLNNIFWNRIFPVAFILMWIAMSLSFMSIWSGLIALTTIMTGYTMGVSLAHWIPSFYGQPTLWFLPLLTLPAVLGVGMDYNSFYMNRQRYELMTNKRITGYEGSARAIRAVSHLVLGLGLIVTSTYSALVIGSSWGVRELGIALSTSILVTTLMSAFLLTPAILALMDRKAWWPGSRRWSRK
ncbi:MAG: hypothetical protein B6U89_04500 [Desulfurococcales archaeon ex4484_58]|nr:MAG: hypothetical protein B6U89_04500 [Desulfurococcales archaeon ex4484_58]